MTPPRSLHPGRPRTGWLGSDHSDRLPGAPGRNRTGVSTMARSCPAAERQAHGADGPDRTGFSASSARRYSLSATSAWSSHPDSNRDLRLTRAGPCLWTMRAWSKGPTLVAEVPGPRRDRRRAGACPPPSSSGGQALGQAPYGVGLSVVGRPGIEPGCSRLRGGCICRSANDPR